MKRTVIISCVSVLALLIFGAAVIQTETCDSKTIKAKLKGSLNPYKYDQAKVTKIIYRKKASVKEIEVPLFIGEKYRMVFNTENVGTPIVINVYNKDKDSKNRKLLFTTKDQGKDKKEFVFEPEKRAMKMYVNYEIPASDSAGFSCVGFMLGYK